MISDHDRLIVIEREIARIARRIGEPRGRDTRGGRAVLSARVGDEVAALVRCSARQSGRTISDWVRQVILAAVNQPSTGHVPEVPSERGSHMRPRTLPTSASANETARRTLSTNFADQARLAAADAAVMADSCARPHQDSGDGAVFLPGSPWARR